MKGFTKKQNMTTTTKAQREERVLCLVGWTQDQLQPCQTHGRRAACLKQGMQSASREFVVLELHNFPGPVQNEDTSVLEQH